MWYSRLDMYVDRQYVHHASYWRGGRRIWVGRRTAEPAVQVPVPVEHGTTCIGVVKWAVSGAAAIGRGEARRSDTGASRLSALAVVRRGVRGEK